MLENSGSRPLNTGRTLEASEPGHLPQSRFKGTTGEVAIPQIVSDNDQLERLTGGCPIGDTSCDKHGDSLQFGVSPSQGWRPPTQTRLGSRTGTQVSSRYP